MAMLDSNLTANPSTIWYTYVLPSPAGGMYLAKPNALYTQFKN